MNDILYYTEQYFEQLKTTLHEGSSSPITVTFISQGKPVVHFSSLNENPQHDEDFMHRLTTYPQCFPEIDAGFISAVGEIIKNKVDKPDKAILIGYCTKTGEKRAFMQPFTVIAKEAIFYGEKEEVIGDNNFCDFLLLAFNIKR